MKTKLNYVVGIAILIIAASFFVSQQVKQGKIDLPAFLTGSKTDKLGKAAVDFINSNLLPPGTTASLVKVTNEGAVYKVQIKVGSDEPSVYVSKDGRFLFTTAFEMKPAESPKSQSPDQEMTKKDRPDVKLFVMSYCPFGLQMEKVYLPVYQLLKDKADFGIYFVDYIMHGKPELDENLRQHCLQKLNKPEFAKYLNCFVGSGEASACLDKTNVSQTELSQCIVATDSQFKITSQYNDKSSWNNGQYPVFNVDAELNKQYSVQGSPTIVINDKQVSLNQRSAEAFKNLICQAFNNPPSECSQVLSADAPEVGIGSGSGNESGNASCGQ